MNILVILGPTASGKTRLAVQLARHCRGEILSADSRQVYRGLDIGTGKDLEEYGPIPYHLIDLVEPGEPFDLFRFQQRCLQLLPQIAARNALPILTGGSGLYLESIIRDYRLTPAPPDAAQHQQLEALTDAQLIARLLALKPDQHNTTDLEARTRTIRAIEIAQAHQQEQPDPSAAPSTANHFLILGLRWERTQLRERIAIRLQQRLENGLIEEVASLLNRSIPPATLEALGLEYRFVTRHLLGLIDRETLFSQLVQAIRQFAKRQETWFRRMERHGMTIHWIDASRTPEQTALRIIRQQWPHLCGSSSLSPPA